MVGTVVLAALTMKAVVVATIAVLWWQKWLQVATAFLFRTVYGSYSADGKDGCDGSNVGHSYNGGVSSSMLAVALEN